MIKHFLILLCFVTLYVQSSYSVITPDDEKLRAIIRDKGQAEIVMDRPGPAEMNILTRNISIASVRDNKIYLIVSPLTADWFLSRGYSYSIVERDEAKGIVTASNIRRALEWDTYPSYTQYDSIMRFFTATWPGLCRLDTIGTSVLGKLVLAVRITSTSNNVQSKPGVFYSSTMHGNETAGFVLMLRLAQFLLQNYGIDPYVTRLVDNLEIWINPLANPDGTYRGGNEIINPVRDNANGYDLNRNFPDPTEPGNQPQKETRDMMKFLSLHRFSLSANFHSGSEVVNYPWDRWPQDHADVAWFYHICRNYADTAHVYSPKGYMTYLDNGVTNGYEWYPVYGGRQDYVTWNLNGREITIELDTSFVTPVSLLQVLWESNRRSLLGYLENAIFGIHGRVTDSYTGDPVPAKITIAGYDRDNSEVYSDTLTGNFVRYLYPGSRDITFSAEGYRDTIIQNVTVADHESTDLMVRMEPVIKPIVTDNDIYLFPDPAGDYVRALLSERLRDKVRIRIFSIAGAMIMNFNGDASGSGLIEISVSRLAAGTYIISVINESTGYSAKAKFIVGVR